MAELPDELDEDGKHGGVNVEVNSLWTRISLLLHFSTAGLLAGRVGLRWHGPDGDEGLS